MAMTWWMVIVAIAGLGVLGIIVLGVILLLTVNRRDQPPDED